MQRWQRIVMIRAESLTEMRPLFNGLPPLVMAGLVPAIHAFTAVKT
jgi:hypothetical protein